MFQRRQVALLLISVVAAVLVSIVTASAASQKPATAAEIALYSAADRQQRLEEGAKKEGKLTFYTSMDLKASELLVNSFTKRYPFIKIKIYRNDMFKLLDRILIEARAKKHDWDIVMSGDSTVEVLKSKELLTKYLSPHSQYYLAGSKDPDGYWIDSYVNYTTVGFNTKLVSPRDVPKSWEDLLDPKWRGKMGIVPQRPDWLADMLKEMGEKRGMEYMKKLAQQNITWRTGSSLNAQLLAAGEFALAPLLYNNIVERYKAMGAAIDWIALEPITPLLHPIAISAHTQSPNTARLFHDFVLSKEGQELIATLYWIPPRIDVEARIPRMKCQGLRILPINYDYLNNYNKYWKLFQEVLVRRQ